MQILTAVIGTVVVATVSLAGCAGGTDDGGLAVDEATPHARATTPTQLTCPTNERVSTAGGYWARLPDGSPTPDEAVEAWMSRTHVGDDFALTEDGNGAWILRSDGTAVAKVEFIRHSGYTVDGYEACAPTT